MIRKMKVNELLTLRKGSKITIMSESGEFSEFRTVDRVWNNPLMFRLTRDKAVFDERGCEINPGRDPMWIVIHDQV